MRLHITLSMVLKATSDALAGASHFTMSPAQAPACIGLLTALPGCLRLVSNLGNCTVRLSCLMYHVNGPVRQTLMHPTPCG